MTIRRFMVKNNHRDPEQGSAMQEGKKNEEVFLKVTGSILLSGY